MGSRNSDISAVHTIARLRLDQRADAYITVQRELIRKLSLNEILLESRVSDQICESCHHDNGSYDSESFRSKKSSKRELHSGHYEANKDIREHRHLAA